MNSYYTFSALGRFRCLIFVNQSLSDSEPVGKLLGFKLMCSLWLALNITFLPGIWVHFLFCWPWYLVLRRTYGAFTRHVPISPSKIRAQW